MSVAEAKLELKKILLEGVFIYFFAKFSHSMNFAIKYSYYLKSEPIRLVALTILFLQIAPLALHRHHYYPIFPTISREHPILFPHLVTL
jgi:hypothetical protein